MFSIKEYVKEDHCHTARLSKNRTKWVFFLRRRHYVYTFKLIKGGGIFLFAIWQSFLGDT